MTTTIYIRARDPDNGARVVDELLGLGIPRDRLEVHGRHIPAGVSVTAKPWRGGTRPLVPAALVGAASLPTLAALTLVEREASFLFVLALLGASAGVTWARHRLHDA